MAVTPALVDSHCHIVFRNFDDDLDEVASRWREAGVQALVHACVEPASFSLSPPIHSCLPRKAPCSSGGGGRAAHRNRSADAPSLSSCSVECTTTDRPNCVDSSSEMASHDCSPLVTNLSLHYNSQSASRVFFRSLQTPVNPVSC